MTFDPLGIMYPGIIFSNRDSLESWLDLHSGNPQFKMIYRPGLDEADFEGMAREADYFCRMARELGDVEVFFDEIDSFSRAKEAPPELESLLNFGRRHNVGMYCAVRRPQVKIPRSWITETNRFLIFRTCDPNDAIFLQRYTGIDYRDILDLEQFEYFEWNEGDIKRKKMQNPYKK